MGLLQQVFKRLRPQGVHARDLKMRGPGTLFGQRHQRLPKLFGGRGVFAGVTELHMGEAALDDVLLLLVLLTQQTDERRRCHACLFECAHAGAGDEDVGGGDDVDEAGVGGAPSWAAGEGLRDAGEDKATFGAGAFDEPGDGGVAVVRIQIDRRQPCRRRQPEPRAHGALQAAWGALRFAGDATLQGFLAAKGRRHLRSPVAYIVTAEGGDEGRHAHPTSIDGTRKRTRLRRITNRCRETPLRKICVGRRAC